MPFRTSLSKLLYNWTWLQHTQIYTYKVFIDICIKKRGAFQQGVYNSNARERSRERERCMKKMNLSPQLSAMVIIIKCRGLLPKAEMQVGIFTIIIIIIIILELSTQTCLIFIVCTLPLLPSFHFIFSFQFPFPSSFYLYIACFSTSLSLSLIF